MLTSTPGYVEDNVGVPVNSDSFARLRLTGGRFDGIGMPVEALVELVAYRELIVGVAREVFRGDHPDRQRVPRGFADRLELRLQTVESGSAVPVLERVSRGSQLPFEDEFTHARDLIEDAVSAVADSKTLPAPFPREALVLFNRFGQTLRQDEAIELRSADALTGPTYTSQIRETLVLKQRRTYQKEIEDIGWVSEVDAERMSCSIRLGSGPPTPVPAPLDELTFEPVKEALFPKGEGPPVRIRGIGVFDQDRGLIRLDSIQELSIQDDAEDRSVLERRLDELADLSDGWLDGEGIRPDAGALQRARQVLGELLGLDVPRPRLFATPEGGIQAEWTVDSRECSVTFEPAGGLYAVSVDSFGTIVEPVFESESPERVARLVQQGS